MRLRLYAPESYAPEDERPEVVPFRPGTDRFSGHSDRFSAGNRTQFDVLQRSRVIHDNRQCPSCHHPVVTPVELRDCLVNRNGMPVPGTATLVGFHCDRCDYEWPA